MMNFRISQLQRVTFHKPQIQSPILLHHYYVPCYGIY
uniref:Uncharacterized protein n=1 Tax=Setaria italica TaxID=4555 RepID=K3ZGU6_SETIT